jgi:phage terminase large subunit
MDGINAARITIGSAWFDAERCHAGLEALWNYRAEFDERTKAFNDRPRHDWASDSADAFRYLSLAWQAMQPEQKEPERRRDSWDAAFERANRIGDYSWRVA